MADVNEQLLRENQIRDHKVEVTRFRSLLLSLKIYAEQCAHGERLAETQVELSPEVQQLLLLMRALDQHWTAT